MNHAAPPRIDSRVGFAAALTWGLNRAMSAGARRIVCCDPDFSAWPLSDPLLLQSLTPWLRLPLRRLVLVAADFEPLWRDQPRFTLWRHDWTHAVEAWQPPPERRAGLPRLLCSDGDVCVELLDIRHWHGRAVADARLSHQGMTGLDALLQHCSPAVASRPLGL